VDSIVAGLDFVALLAQGFAGRASPAQPPQSGICYCENNGGLPWCLARDDLRVSSYQSEVPLQLECCVRKCDRLRALNIRCPVDAPLVAERGLRRRIGRQRRHDRARNLKRSGIDRLGGSRLLAPSSSTRHDEAHRRAEQQGTSSSPQR
jgi:hypothetical protein